MKTLKVILIVLLVLPCALDCWAQETIRLTNGEWPPFVSKDLEHGGVISRIVKEAFALKGIQVEYGFFPWKRAFKLAREGNWDGSVVWLYTEERARAFIYSDAVASNQGVFFHLKRRDFDWRTVDDLKDKVIGAVMGYSNGPLLDRAEKAGKVTIERVTTEPINFKKLLAQRIDLFTSDLEVGHSVLNKHFQPDQIRQITYHPKPHYNQSVHLILCKKKARAQYWLECFNKGLKELKQSGRYDQYYQESHIGNYPP